MDTSVTKENELANNHKQEVEMLTKILEEIRSENLIFVYNQCRPWVST